MSVGRDRKLHAWDPDEGENLNGRKDGAGWETPTLPAEPLRLVGGAEGVFVAGVDGVVRTYRRQSPAVAAATSSAFEPFPDWAHGLAFHPGSGLVAAASHGGETRVWSAADGKQIVSFIAAPGYAR